MASFTLTQLYNLGTPERIAKINQCIYVRKTIYLCQYSASKEKQRTCNSCYGVRWTMSRSEESASNIHRHCILTADGYDCQGYHKGKLVEVKFKKIRDFSLIF